MPMFSCLLFRMAALRLRYEQTIQSLFFCGLAGRLYEIGLGVNCVKKTGHSFLFMNLILAVNKDPYNKKKRAIFMPYINGDCSNCTLVRESYL